ncbi:GNAT family N-acetyltransferase [Pseudomonas sp. KU43P]|uniref:GNAT family N-acetyltransferase n=1 Tax=Pseudomonas sp. KU43P TaxID=2487887 RepID=UPI0012A87CE9|nr:GNAT family N-acetyltransferase [Pseudomonas sp. KU43P]BBH44931.1 N-acetyltransferase [Pseudomonas sp. KU43P]
MISLHCTQLIGAERRLLDHFYRQHGSRMRADNEGQLWVARATGIVAGLCLRPLEGGHWLTGLFVAPLQRGQGVAGQLVNAALAETLGNTWLFCHPDLVALYQRLGFEHAATLPQALASRLLRYQSSKQLVALVRAQSSLGSSPGNSTSV